MKCIKKGTDIKRVSNKQAYDLVKADWTFCPKSEWKTNVRDVKKASKASEKKAAKESKEN